MKNDNIKLVLGALLYFGNTMNAANKNRGQADGYETDAFSKSFTIKRSDGKSIMGVILEKIQQDHPGIMNIKDEYKPVFDNEKINLGDLIKDSKKLAGESKQFLTQFENICKVDPDAEDEKFGKILSKCLKQYQSEVDALVTKVEKVPLLQAEACDFFYLEKAHEGREKSEKYFAFWVEFINDCHKNLPKVEKPKAPKKEGTASKAVDPKKAAQAAQQKAMMAEMMKRQGK